MRLTDHFTLAELCQSQTASRLGLDNTPPAPVVAELLRTAVGLEAIRRLVGKPIVVSSGYRSPFVNRAVGGKPNSQHLTGHAADITSPGFGAPDVLMSAIVRSDIEFDQCIMEFYNHVSGTGWVHVSFSDTPRKQALVIDHSGARAWA